MHFQNKSHRTTSHPVFYPINNLDVSIFPTLWIFTTTEKKHSQQNKASKMSAKALKVRLNNKVRHSRFITEAQT